MIALVSKSGCVGDFCVLSPGALIDPIRVLEHVDGASANDPWRVEALCIHSHLWRSPVHITCTVSRPLVHRFHVLTYHATLGRVSKTGPSFGDRLKLLLKLDDLRLWLPLSGLPLLFLEGGEGRLGKPVTGGLEAGESRLQVLDLPNSWRLFVFMYFGHTADFVHRLGQRLPTVRREV